MITILTSTTVEPQQTSTQVRKRAFRALIIIAILAGGIGAFQLGFRLALSTPTPFFVVVSASMVPTLHIGDIVVIRGDPFNSMVVGDVIVFHNPRLRFDAFLQQQCQVSTEDIACVIVHRVYSLSIDGERMVTTKGDANSRPDSVQVIESDYIGKVIFSIPYVGYFSSLIRYPYNYLLIGAVLLFIFVSEFMSSGKKGGTLDNHLVEEKPDSKIQKA